MRSISNEGKKRQFFSVAEIHCRHNLSHFVRNIISTCTWCGRCEQINDTEIYVKQKFEVMRVTCVEFRQMNGVKSSISSYGIFLSHD